jgi:hypothetical protein
VKSSRQVNWDHTPEGRMDRACSVPSLRPDRGGTARQCWSRSESGETTGWELHGGGRQTASRGFHSQSSRVVRTVEVRSEETEEADVEGAGSGKSWIRLTGSGWAAMPKITSTKKTTPDDDTTRPAGSS